MCSTCMNDAVYRFSFTFAIIFKLKGKISDNLCEKSSKKFLSELCNWNPFLQDWTLVMLIMQNAKYYCKINIKPNQTKPIDILKNWISRECSIDNQITLSVDCWWSMPDAETTKMGNQFIDHFVNLSRMHLWVFSELSVFIIRWLVVQWNGWIVLSSFSL